MPNYIQVPINNHGSIKIKIAPVSLDEKGGFQDVSIKSTIKETAESIVDVGSDVFNAMMNTVQALAYGVQDKINEMKGSTTLDEVSLEFGLNIDGKGSVQVLELGAGADFKVSLKWKVTKGL